MAFVTRKISVTFALGLGSFGADGSDTVTIEGLRTSVSITQAGGVSMAQLDLRIWGMPLDTMQKLTVLNKIAYQEERNNYVSITAGDDQSGMSLVFNGMIKEAWADASGAPEICFVVSAFAGMGASIRPVPPTSFKGPVSADVFFSSIAKLVTDGTSLTPYALENSGVTGTLDNPYWAGTARQQLDKAADALNCNVTIDTVKQVIAIWPAGSARGQNILDVSPATGLVGYPQWTQNGLVFTTLYSPSIVFGQQVKVSSPISDGVPVFGGAGTWAVASISHNLDAELPGGQWFTRAECYLFGHTAPIIN
jgi:hypothetical protein